MEAQEISARVNAAEIMDITMKDTIWNHKLYKDIIIHAKKTHNDRLPNEIISCIYHK